MTFHQFPLKWPCYKTALRQVRFYFTCYNFGNIKEPIMKIIKIMTKYSTRIILGLFAVLAIGFIVYMQSTQISMSKLTLVKEDTFDGTSLSEDWLIIDDGSFHYTGFFDKSQVSVVDGNLSIKLSYKDGAAGEYLYSSEIHSAASYTTGYFEVTAILPKINNFNAVIALSSHDALLNTDPALGAKIVFASSNNQPYPLLASGIYYDNLGDPTETKNPFIASLIYGEAHRYGVLWTKDSYSFYFDGYKLWESAKTATSTKPLYLSFGFEFPYYTTQDITKIDQTLIIKSVKIYELKP